MLHAPARLPSRPRERLRTGLLIAACWLGWGALYAVKLRAVKESASLVQVLHYAFSDAVLWALATPLVLALARRFPVRPPLVLRRVLQHLGLGLALSLALLVVDGLQNRFLGLPGTSGLPLTEFLGYAIPGWLHSHLMLYAAVLAIAHVLEHQRALVTSERQLGALRASLAEARLATLRARLRPHFLFNSLNTIAGLAETRPADARRTTVRLAELLRASLETDGREFVPLREELRITRTYLALEQARFGERLRVEVDVDLECEELLVPAFLLQPLAENAVRHGLASLERPGCVRIEARREADMLALVVADDGVGPGAGPAPGFGLRSVRERLGCLFGTSQSCRLRPRTQGGTEVQIRLPALAATPAVA
ncbi:MAG TPA: histidine kinase [Planctomycetota bacterium]